MRAHTRTHARTHALTHTHAHTHTHARTHALSYTHVQLSDQDIRLIISADREAAARRAGDPRMHRTHPKTLGLPPPARPQPHVLVPFVPINPFQAKDTVYKMSEEVGAASRGPAPA